MADLDKALNGAWLDCGQDFQKQQCNSVRRQSVGYCLGLVRAGKAYGKQGTIQTILERRTDSDLPQGRTNRCYRKSLYRQSAHFD